MNFKRIPVITEMKINTLNCVRTYCGEYETKIDIAFLLEQKCKFYIFNEEYEIDRVKIIDYYGDSIGVVFANEKELFFDFPVPKSFLHQMFKIIKEYETKDENLKSYNFSEDLYELLIDKRVHRFFY
ncbi:hypothetical protein [Clostridium perfringens]|uniref:hypothetical protein n=1 Tax=Clostridium perfringens TaxID=1502 RepID=UPI0039ECEC14